MGSPRRPFETLEQFRLPCSVPQGSVWLGVNAQLSYSRSQVSGDAPGTWRVSPQLAAIGHCADRPAALPRRPGSWRRHSPPCPHVLNMTFPFPRMSFPVCCSWTPTTSNKLLSPPTSVLPLCELELGWLGLPCVLRSPHHQVARPTPKGVIPAHRPGPPPGLGKLTHSRGSLSQCLAVASSCPRPPQ